MVSNISRKITEDELKSKLARFGKIRGLEFRHDGDSRGVATVTFSSPEAAETVLKEEAIFVNNKRLDIQPWKPYTVSRSTRVEPSQDDEDVVPYRLHVRNLGYSTSPKDLKRYFGQFGEVEEAWVVDDPQTGKPKGVGYVQFKSQESAARAMKHELHTLDGRTIYPHFAKLSAEFNLGQGLSATRLHLSNVPSDMSSKDIRKHFAKFGNIVDLYLVPEREGRSSGVGFVEYGTHKEAATCIRETRHIIGDAEVIVSYARLRAGEGGQPAPSTPAPAFPSVFNSNPAAFPNMPFFSPMMANPFLFPATQRLAAAAAMGAGMRFPYPNSAPTRNKAPRLR